jgi:hypothetical protein
VEEGKRRYIRGGREKGVYTWRKGEGGRSR